MTGRELRILNGKLVLSKDTLTVCVEGHLPFLITMNATQKYRLVRWLRNQPTDGQPVRLGKDDHVKVLRHVSSPNLQFVDLHTEQKYTAQMDGAQRLIFVNFVDWHTCFWESVL